MSYESVQMRGLGNSSFGALPAGVQADNSGACGSYKGLQQMLADLGFYAGPITGVADSATAKAVQAFAASKGVPIGGADVGGMFPKATICQAVIDAWTAKTASTPITIPLPGVPTVPSSLFAPPPTPPTPKSAATSTGMAKALAPIFAKPKAAASPAPAGAPLSWWDRQSTGAKVAIVGGGVVALGALAFVLAKPAPATATANRRRSRR